MTQDGESPREASLLTNLVSTKTTTNIGTWNIRTLYESGKSAQVAKEMNQYKINVLGLCETRWNGSGRTKLSSGETIIYSGHQDLNHNHTQGVAFLLTPEANKALMEWNPISPRIISARFNSKGRNITILQCYAPTNAATDTEKVEFYDSLQNTITKSPKRDIKIVMGDLNAKVGNDNRGHELIMGKFGEGVRNENGELLTEFCSFNDLVIGGTIFRHKSIHKATWISPDGRTKNQIDHFTIARKWRRSLLDVKVRRGADAASDHHLLLATMKLKLRAFRDRADRPHSKYNILGLKNKTIAENFLCTIKNRFDVLTYLNDESIEKQWDKIKQTWTTACDKTLGKREIQHKKWLSPDTWNLISQRKNLKQHVNKTYNPQEKARLQTQYWELNKMVKKSARQDKRNYIQDLAGKAETAAGKRDLKQLYDITRTLSGKNRTISQPVKDKDGKIITKENEQRQRWSEHFKHVLNRPTPNSKPNIPPAEEIIDVNIDPPTKLEIIKAIKALKNGKAAGPDGIPPEALKADVNSTAEMMHPLLSKIWQQEIIPKDWKEGYMVKLPKKGNLTHCDNWRGIMLLSVPSKILSRIILDRLKRAIDSQLRSEQAGFRQDKSCTDHIATLRIIIEQSIEWQSSLYITFVDFEKAFDSLDREVMWSLMGHYGIPQKFISIIKEMYQDSTCRVIHNGKLTDSFDIKTGVKQGCLLSPIIFLMAIDWVMKSSTGNTKTGLKWSFSKYLEDLDYADDVSLLSHRHQDAQTKLNRLAIEAEKTGLKINTKKTEVMRINSSSTSPIQLQGVDINESEKFSYLGSVVSNTGGTNEDIKSRIGKARQAFIALKPIWNSTEISNKTKIRLFNTNVKSVLLYGSETWRVTKTITKKIQVFVNKSLRSILKIRWTDKVTNEELRKRSDQMPIGEEVLKRKWGWIGHTLRKEPSNVTRQALEWNPQGKRKVGRPKESWRRSVEKEVKEAGWTWSHLKKMAQNRTRWRSFVAALCPTWDEEE